MKARGFRNNNPLNIRRGTSHWVGQCAEQNDSAFVQFESMAHGYRAAWKILASYYRRFKTVDKQDFNVENIISRWAPPGDDNDTQGYISQVVLLTTQMPVDKLQRCFDGDNIIEICIGSLGAKENLMPPETKEGMYQLTKLLRAMTCVENGCRLKDVPVKEINRGYKLAFKRAPTFFVFTADLSAPPSH